MPTRDIKTRLVIEGENEYKAAISKINGELKLLDSALKETESRYQTNANSMEALQKKSEALTAVQEAQQRKVEETARALDNARQAVDTYSRTGEDLQRKLQEENASWEALNATRKASAEETAAHEKAVGDLNRQIGENNGMLEAAQKSAQGWETSLNKANTQLNDTKTELDQTNGYLDEAKNSTDGCATSIDQFGNKAKEAGEKANNALDMLAAQVAYQTIKKGFDEIRQAITECIDASIEFESAMAGVAKTTDLTDDELAAMGDALQEMSTRIPTAASDLAAITEAAGQLGIQKENLLDFTEVMANLGVATNLSAEEAASSLAKFANVVKMDADNYDRLGSVIVALGNNFATTERDIVSMATRIASTGAIIELSEPQIMAIATALSSVGIEAEAGGSAISKLLKNMEVSAKSYGTANETIRETGYTLRELELLADQDSKGFKELAGSLGMTSGELKNFMNQKKTLEQFADVAGMTAEAFIDLWGRDAVQALDAFIGGLNDTDRTGQSAVQTLNDMGLTEIRLSNAVLSLASNGHILTDSVELANQAWDENNALAKEAETRYATTESKMQLLDNSVQALKASIGDQLTPALRNFADAGIDATKWAKDFIQQHEWVVPVIGGLASSMGALTAIIGGYFIATKTVIPIIQAFNTALAANPAALAAVAIGAVVTALAAFIELRGKTDTTLDDLIDRTKDLANAAQESADAYEETKAAMETQDAEIERMTERVKELAAKEELSAEEKAEMLELIKRLNAAVPDLALAWDEETHSLNMSVEAMEKRIRLQRDQEKLTAAVQHKLDLEEQLAQAEENHNALLETRAELQQKIDEITEKYTRNGQVQLQSRAYQDEIRGLKQEYAELGGAIQTSESSMESMRGQLDATKAEIEGYSGAVETAKAAVNELSEAEEEAAKAAKEAAKLTEEAIEEAEAAAEKAVDFMLEQIEDLNEAYAASYEACYKALSGAMDLWGEAEDKTKVSIEEMIANLEKQMEAEAKYFDNLLALEQAAAEGRIQISDSMRSVLSQNNEDAKLLAQNLVDTLAKNDDELVQRLSDTMDKADQQNKRHAQVLAEFETDYDNTMTRIVQTTQNRLDDIEREYDGFSADMYDLGELAGENFGRGLSAGIRNMTSVAETAARDMGKKAAVALNRSIEAQSPSKVTTQSGEWFGQGFANGIKNEDGSVSAAAEKIAKSAMDPISALKDRLQGEKSQLAGIVESILQELSAKAAIAETIAASIKNAFFGASSSAASAAAAPASGGFGINYDNNTAPSWIGSGAVEASAEWIESLGWKLPDLTPQPVAGAAQSTTKQEVSLTVEVKEMNVREESDIQKVSEGLYQLVQQQSRGVGVIL